MENKEPAILIVRLDHVTATHDNKVVESNLNPVFCTEGGVVAIFRFPQVKFHYKVKIRLKKATQHSLAISGQSKYNRCFFVGCRTTNEHCRHKLSLYDLNKALT